MPAPIPSLEGVCGFQATGWTNHWNGAPVVRLPVYADEYWRLGTNLTTLLAGKLATNGNGSSLTGITAAQVGATTASDVTNIVAAATTGSFVVNLTSNKTTAFTFAPTNATYLGDCSGGAMPASSTVSVPIGTNGNYAFAWGCTSITFTALEGTYVDVSLLCAENEPNDITAKVEIYRRDVATDVLTEWGDGGATFTVPDSATPVEVVSRIFCPSVETNAFLIWTRVKRVGGLATAARLLIVGSGAGSSTHFSLSVPANVPIDAHNASPTAHATRFAAVMTNGQPVTAAQLPPSVVTGAVFAATGTQPSITLGLLSIPTNGLGGGGGGGVTESTVTNIVLTVGAAQGWSTNTAWTWQGAQIVPMATNLYTITYTPPAQWSAGSNRHELLPYSTTNYGVSVTGVLTIVMVSNLYLAGISGTWYDSRPGGLNPASPINSSSSYESSTSAVLMAWCSQDQVDAAPEYSAYFSNLVVYSYDRTGMQSGQYTNDAAGIVARVDPLPSGNTDNRRVVSAESLASAIAVAKPDIAKEAWRYTPSGARQPSASTCTIDMPLIQQGQMAYLQSGNYYAMSYQGGDWYSSGTGSAWRLGPGGKVAFEILSTNRMLFISAFSVATNWATIDIPTTNLIVGTPYVEFCQDLASPQWLACPAQIVTSNADFWRVQCPATATQRFYRAVSPGGANAINSYYQHNFPEGITVRGQSFDAAVAASVGAGTYYITNTVVVSNSLDFAITGLAANNVKVRYLVMFSSSTNEASGSRRGDFSVFTRPDRLCDSVIYSDSNQLYWAATSASAQAAGATTGTVADASGVVLRQRYAVGNGTRWDFLTATNATATTIFWGCTNKYATTATADTKIASANYSTPIYYDDDSAQNSMWCRFAWTTGHTGTVTTVMRYSK